MEGDEPVLFGLTGEEIFLALCVIGIAIFIGFMVMGSQNYTYQTPLNPTPPQVIPLGNSFTLADGTDILLNADFANEQSLYFKLKNGTYEWASTLPEGYKNSNGIPVVYVYFTLVKNYTGNYIEG